MNFSFDSLLPVMNFLADYTDNRNAHKNGAECRCHPTRYITTKKPYTVIYQHPHLWSPRKIERQHPIILADPSKMGSRHHVESCWLSEGEIKIQDAANLIKPMPPYRGEFCEETC